MVKQSPAKAIARLPARRPDERLGAAVVREFVELIVTGAFAEGEILPPEVPLSEHFGVSRTVLRESVKRVQEKGLVVVTQGRGTQVAWAGSWNMLDPTVLSVLIENDESLGVLDELTIVRASLESVMAGRVALRHTEGQLRRIEHALETMRDMERESDAFRQADVVFHFAVMEASGNRLAENIAKSLYRRALESERYQGMRYEGAFRSTLDAHAQVLDMIAGHDVEGAERAMRAHIQDSWQQRRFGSGPAEEG